MDELFQEMVEIYYVDHRSESFAYGRRGAAFSMDRSTRSEMNMTCAVVSEETRLIGTKCACL